MNSYYFFRWYNVNYKMAERLIYGFGKGCDFAKKSCKDYMEMKRNALVFLINTVYICIPIVTLGIHNLKLDIISSLSKYYESQLLL